MIYKLLAAVSMIFVVSGGVYSVKYIEHQTAVIADMDARIKTLEERVFPPKKSAEESKKTSKRQSKNPS